MLTMQRSTLSFAAIILFAVLVAIFLVRKGNDAANELERLNNGAFGVHRVALAEELDSDNRTPDISNWKMYSNKKYGFEVKYPNDYFLKETDRRQTAMSSSFGVIISTPETQKFLESTTGELSDQIFIFPHVTSYQLNEQLIYPKPIQNSENYFLSQPKDNFNKYLGIIHIDGKMGFQLIHSESADEKIIIFQNKDSTWFMARNVTDSNKNYDNIISTLKFFQ